jgi:hypothetical protein
MMILILKCVKINKICFEIMARNPIPAPVTKCSGLTTTPARKTRVFK